MEYYIDKKYIENLIENSNNDNANLGYNPEVIAKYVHDNVMKQYALDIMPKEVAEAHSSGILHVHDAEYYALRPNCLSGNNKIIIKDNKGIVSYIRLDEFVEKWQSDIKEYYVPSFNIKDCVMEWNKVVNAYKSSDNEQVYSVKFNKGYRIECTSDHKFIKSHNNKPCNEYDIKVSDFDNYKNLRLINMTNIYDYNSNNDYYKSALFGFFLGDGHIDKNGSVKFCFSKTDKARYCDNLLKKLGLDYSYNVYEADCYKSGLRHDFYIRDKIYPNMTKSQLIYHFKSQLNLKGVFEGLVNSDGCVRLDINNTLRCNFTSTNKDIFDLYHLCLLSLGLRGSISFHKPTNEKHSTAYISSTFGFDLINLFNEITLRDVFKEYHTQVNRDCKQYKEISEITPKSIEYIGEMPVYNLTIENNHNYMAGVDGFVLTQNCFNFDLRFFIKSGLVIDGKGIDGSVASPARSLEVLLNHLLQAFMAGAQVFSGGQGLANFNTFLAPLCRGRSYYDIKQCIQGFIFNCNMSLVAKGGQCIFTSVGLDMSVPNHLKDVPAVTFEGETIGVYKDYQREADMIFKAFLEVLNEKDASGQWHRFPNTLINIQDGDLDEYKGTCKVLHELGANNPTLYYTNQSNYVKSIMGCVDGSEGIWCKIDNKVTYKTFFALSDLLKADYGLTPVNMDLKVLTIDDNKKVYWEQVKNFIWNEDRVLYKVSLSDGKSFICDDQHELLTFEGINPINVFDCSDKTNLLGLNYYKNDIDCEEMSNYKSVKISSIEKVGYGDSFCIEVNGRMIFGEDFILSAQCRTALPDNFTGIYDLDCLNTGNFAYTTLNLPLLALEANGDVDEFYELLDKYCDIARTGLLNRREIVKDVIYNKHMSDFLLQRDKVTGIPLYDIDRTTITLGFCGLYECMKILNYNFGEDIIQFINAKTKQYKLEDGLRWSVIASPAESASHRFAMIIKDKYPDVELNGNKGNYYLTNSSHIPVSYESDIVAHIRNADKYHPLSKGGNILHLWLGETYHNPVAIWKLNKKILATNTNFWAFTNDFSYCNDCHNTFNEALDSCSICGSEDLTVFSRITGYYVPVKNWNKGKKQEFEDRYRHKNI